MSCEQASLEQQAPGEQEPVEEQVPSAVLEAAARAPIARCEGDRCGEGAASSARGWPMSQFIYDLAWVLLMCIGWLALLGIADRIGRLFWRRGRR
jgi:hypothetical protein